MAEKTENPTPVETDEFGNTVVRDADGNAVEYVTSLGKSIKGKRLGVTLDATEMRDFDRFRFANQLDPADALRLAIQKLIES